MWGKRPEPCATPDPLDRIPAQPVTSAGAARLACREQRFQMPEMGTTVGALPLGDCSSPKGGGAAPERPLGVIGSELKTRSGAAGNKLVEQAFRLRERGRNGPPIRSTGLCRNRPSPSHRPPRVLNLRHSPVRSLAPRQEYRPAAPICRSLLHPWKSLTPSPSPACLQPGIPCPHRQRRERQGKASLSDGRRGLSERCLTADEDPGSDRDIDAHAERIRR